MWICWRWYLITHASWQGSDLNVDDDGHDMLLLIMNEHLISVSDCKFYTTCDVLFVSDFLFVVVFYVFF